MKVRWTRIALSDLRSIHTYIADQNPTASPRILRLLRAQAESLADHPLTAIPVGILAIRRSARAWPTSFD